MQPDHIRELLEQVKSGARDVDAAFLELAELPFTDLGDAKIDNHRALRCGFAEVVLCRGKEPRDVARIIEEGLRSSPMMLATRAEKRHVDALKERFPNAHVNLRGGTVRVGNAVSMKARGSVMVVTAGTGDIPVAEEALETLRAFGCDAWHFYDVGVAGLHRVLSVLPKLREAAVIICVAGMEGALPSVIGGLVACPVIAVPTSIGYGASFNGVAALLGMLNTCAAGVSVVNIDNGFGAAMNALRIVADRDWPIVEAPAAQESEDRSQETGASVQARDEMLSRLERAVENLVTLTQKPITIESPTIEINHPDQSEQVSRLEKAICELAVIATKQKELEEKKLTPVVVESPKIEINHPDQSEQVARLEKAIVELAAIAAKQKELSEQRVENNSGINAEVLARLDRSVESLAASAARPVVLELKHAPIPPAAETALPPALFQARAHTQIEKTETPEHPVPPPPAPDVTKEKPAGGRPKKEPAAKKAKK